MTERHPTTRLQVKRSDNQPPTQFPVEHARPCREIGMVQLSPYPLGGDRDD